MNNTTFVILLLLAQLKSSLGATREYHYVALEKTWPEAQRYCRENFADLATIETEEDGAIVQKFAESTGKYVWIGLHEDINGWKWSIDNTYLYKDGTTGFGAWFNFSPDNYSGIEKCVVIFKGILADQTCGLLRKSVCYHESTNKYIPVTILMTWSSAQSYCRETYTDLTSMRSLQEKEGIMKVVDQSEWWIGLYRDWTWSDQSKSTLRLWAPSDPNGAGKQLCVCAIVNRWYDLECHIENPFVCSVPRTMVFKLVLKVGGSVDMNDPLVQEAVLKNMEKHMKDHGVQQTFRLRWRKQPSGNIFNKIEA